jgi:hypothetical protein
MPFGLPPESMFTFAGIPSERQLDLRLRIGAFDWLVIAAGLFLVVCLEFRDFRITRGWFLTTRPTARGYQASGPWRAGAEIARTYNVSHSTISRLIA